MNTPEEYAATIDTPPNIPKMNRTAIAANAVRSIDMKMYECRLLTSAVWTGVLLVILVKVCNT